MVVGCHQQPTIAAIFFDNGGCTLMATNPTNFTHSTTSGAKIYLWESVCDCILDL
jgi:hypothetical protein